MRGLITRYDDVLAVLKDERFGKNKFKEALSNHRF